MTLYQLNAEFEELYNLLCDLPDDDQEALEAYYTTLEGIQGEIDQKMENIACFIKQLNADAAALKAERDAIDARMKTKQHKADRLKAMLQDALVNAGLKRLEMPKAKISLRQNPPSVIITDLSMIAASAYIKPRVIKEADVDKTAIKAAIQSGEEVPGAMLESKTSITIK